MDASQARKAKDFRSLLDTLTPERRAMLALRLSRQTEGTAARAELNDLLDPSQMFGRPGELVEIQPGAGRGVTPFFCVHPAGGNVFCYATLARHLGAERPFYGFPASGGSEAEDETRPSLETLAARYLETLRRARPHGPYLLGGWSMGGIVAFEMARQLTSLGEHVTLLALFDSKIPNLDERQIAADETALLWSFARDLGLQHKRLRDLPDDLFASQPDVQERRLFELAKTAGMLPANTEIAQVRKLLQVFKTNVRAMCGYVPREYAGTVRLYKARDEAARDLADPRLGWGETAARGLEIHTIPGTHYTIMREPHVRTLAAQLRDCLRQADEG
jgi:thioesterase domain-containing protein